jgi:hypothetical protein
MTKDIAAITSFFSYVKNDQAIKRYYEFKENLSRQNVDLYTIELAFFDEEFLLDDDIYLRLRSDSVLWHKESLLNILVKRLPPHIKKVVWLDADVFIQDDDWDKKMGDMLDSERLVQIGSTFHFMKESELNNGLWTEEERCSMKTIGHAYKNTPEHMANFKHHHVGLGWGANRDFFDEVGLFDYDVTGTGDTITYLSCAGLVDVKDSEWIKRRYSQDCPTILPLREDYKKRAWEYAEGRVNYLDTEVIHRYHCPVKRRGYFSRLDLLKGLNYNTHFERDRNGLLQWKDKRMNKPFEIFFSMKDYHLDEYCEYYGINNHYEGEISP